MAEERKIITEEEWEWGAIRFAWVDLENAPEKGWTPLCFDEHSMADSKFCDGEHEVNWLGYVQKELREECLKCPWLKR